MTSTGEIRDDRNHVNVRRFFGLIVEMVVVEQSYHTTRWKNLGEIEDIQYFQKNYIVH